MLYYMRSDCYGNHRIFKKDDKGDGIGVLIATFTSLIHAEICLDNFNEI